MANLVAKLLKKSHIHLPKLTPSLIPKPANHIFIANPPIPLSSQPETQDAGLETTRQVYFYPRFPFGYSLNPITSPVCDPSGGQEEDDANTIWADSVKKKRKKKMNKHKYKKLRKRLRRKTKT